jgi:hypothetical protein
MASYFYDGAMEAFATAGLDWFTHNIKLVLCKSGYVASKTADNFLSDITAGNRVAVSGNLSGKTYTDGILDAEDITIASASFLNTGPATQLVIYRDTGVEATSRLIIRGDGNDYAGLAGSGYTHAGLDLKIQFPNDANKIGKL